MAFGAVITLLLFYFIRPQDWVSGMAGFNIVKPVVAIGLLGLVSRSPSETRWRFMSTPMEWALVIFGGYVVFTSPVPMDALADVGVLIVFAFLTLHAINSEDRLLRFLRWWLFSLVIVAGMAVATHVGWDITNAKPLIDQMRGRFALNTWTLNNPNAFGHTMVTVLPLSYYLLFYRRSSGCRIGALSLMVLAIWVIIPTESKGSFLAGGVGLMTVLMFGRKLWAQVSVALLAAVFASSVLALLPRMEGMKNLRGDEGVQGRLLAWDAARTVTLTKPNGAGYKQFEALVLWQGILEPKATHSAFVRIGADLGVTGLIIYMGMLVVGLRAVMQFPGLTESMERSRRILFALQFTFIVSGWMIDRSYHTELFLMLGAAGAYHQISLRHRLVGIEDDDEEDVEDEEPASFALPLIPLGPRPVLAGENALAMSSELAGGRMMPEQDGETEEEVTVDRRRYWHRLGVVDVLLAILAGQGMIALWDYVMRNL